MAVTLSGLFATQINFSETQNYTQLTVGNLAWQGNSKASDYFTVLLFFVYSVAFYVGFHRLGCLVQGRYSSEEKLAFRKLGIYTLIPASLWLGTQFTGGESLTLVWLSAIAIVSLAAFTCLAVGLSTNFRQDGLFFESVSYSILIVLLAPINGLAALLAWGRLNLTWQPTMDEAPVAFLSLFSIGALVVAATLWISYRKNGFRLYKSLYILLVSIQGLIPLLFWILLPSPWTDDSRRYYGYVIQPQLLLLIGLLCVASYSDLCVRLVKGVRLKTLKAFNRAARSPISPLVLIAILLFLKTPWSEGPQIITDDYHYGEYLLPYWLWSDFSYIPFNDYSPARGLVNYVSGWLSNLFFDGTASAMALTYVSPLFILPYLAITYLCLAYSIGALTTFTMLIVMRTPSYTVFDIHLVLTSALCLLIELWLSCRKTVWLVIWLLVCVGLVLFAPGQGGLFFIATSPLAGIAFYQAIQRERHLLKYGALVFLAAAILVVLTPIGQMLLGALRYGIEQSSLNTEAYGIAWSASQGTNPVFSYRLWEIVRTSWIVVGVVTALLIRRIGFDPTWPGRKRFLAFAIPITLLAILWIPRALGRIDPAHWSRLGAISIWFICLLLPTLLVVAFGKRYQPLILVSVVGIGGLVSYLPPTSDITTLDQRLQLPLQSPLVQASGLVEGQTIGMPNLGDAIVASDHKHQLQTIKTVLDWVLEPGETYLDLTNRNAQYFYFGYPPPIETGAAYNLVHNNQQLRAIADLETALPPIVLAEANNFLHDGGKVSLRSHLLYRYATENYIPIQIEGYVFMVRPDRLTQLDFETLPALLDSKNYQILLRNSQGDYALWFLENINQAIHSPIKVAVPPTVISVSQMTDEASRERGALDDSHSLPSNVEIIGARNFDEDPAIDWLVFNSEAGRLEVWLTSEKSLKDVKPLPILAPEWKVIGIAKYPTELNTYEGSPHEMRLNAQGIALLDQAFLTSNLQAIPSSWGQSFESLAAELELITSLSAELIESADKVEAIAPNRFQISEGNGRLRLNLDALGLSGQEAGILVFDFRDASDRDNANIKLHWTSELTATANTSAVLEFTAHSGTQIVPLDAAPQWLKSEQLKTLEFEIADPDGQNFVLSNIRLMQRKLVTEANQITTS